MMCYRGVKLPSAVLSECQVQKLEATDGLSQKLGATDGLSQKLGVTIQL
jgi:hypothetical protein